MNRSRKTSIQIVASVIKMYNKRFSLMYSMLFNFMVLKFEASQNFLIFLSLQTQVEILLVPPSIPLPHDERP